MSHELESIEQSDLKAALVDDDDSRQTTTLQKSKKEQRKERKKRKLLALSAVMMLNEQGAAAVEKYNNGESGSDKMKQILAKNRTAFHIGECANGDKAEPVASKRQKNDSEVDVDRGIGNSPEADKDYRALKAYVNQKKAMRNVPRIILKPVGQAARVDRKQKQERIPLLLDDIQAMLMHTFLRSDSPNPAPRWVTIEKNARLTHTVVLIVEGFSCEDFITYREHMTTCTAPGVFGSEYTLQVVCPAKKILEEVACVPLSDTHKDILITEYGSLEAAMRFCKDEMLVRRSIFRNIAGSRPTEDGSKYDDLALPPGDKFPRTLLLLSPIQMMNEGIPLPLTGTLENRYQHFVTTSEQYKPVTPSSPMFGVDCEMCGTHGDRSVLTRVSIVDESGAVIYNELVKPFEKIINYRTQFSGIKPEMMVDVTKRLPDVQNDLRKLLPPDAILVGHSISNDLESMQLFHPYIIDTSIVFNVSDNPHAKQKLRVLTKKFLEKDIQCSTDGHDSIEDCAASLNLVKAKLANSIYYGDQWLENRRNYHTNYISDGRNGIADTLETFDTDMQAAGGDTAQARITNTLFSHAKKRNKRSLIITNADEELRTFEAYFGETIQHCEKAGTQQWLSFKKESSANKTVHETTVNCLQYDFNLAYVKLPPRDGEEDGMSEKTAVQIDDWVKRLHTALSLNGLLVVLFVGSEEQQPRAGNASNGRMAVAMVQTKKAVK